MIYFQNLVKENILPLEEEFPLEFPTHQASGPETRAASGGLQLPDGAGVLLVLQLRAGVLLLVLLVLQLLRVHPMAPAGRELQGDPVHPGHQDFSSPACAGQWRAGMQCEGTKPKDTSKSSQQFVVVNKRYKMVCECMMVKLTKCPRRFHNSQRLRRPYLLASAFKLFCTSPNKVWPFRPRNSKPL